MLLILYTLRSLRVEIMADKHFEATGHGTAPQPSVQYQQQGKFETKGLFRYTIPIKLNIYACHSSNDQKRFILLYYDRSMPL